MEAQHPEPAPQPLTVSFSHMSPTNTDKFHDLDVEEIKRDQLLNVSRKPLIDKVYSRSLKGDSGVHDCEDQSKVMSVK